MRLYCSLLQSVALIKFNAYKEKDFMLATLKYTIINKHLKLNIN